MKKFYIPYNLELERLISENLPDFKPFKLDKLLYILSLIFVIPTYNKDLLSEDYTPINSTLLQDVVQNYKEYLNYLEFDLKIIESDHQYIVGEKSKGFRFIEKYRTQVIVRPILDWTLRKKLILLENRKNIQSNRLKYLTKWFNSGLEIDFNSVQKFIDEELKIKMEHPELKDFGKNGKLISPINQYNNSIICSEKILRKEFNLIQDNNVFRLHTNLSNLRSVLRNALTYKGENLISIDLKNSQPYLSIGLLNKNIVNNILHNNSYYYIMLGEILESIENKGFEEFVKLASSGKFYDYLAQKFTAKGFNYYNRKSVKQAVFLLLFTSNRFIGQEEAKPKRIFKELFPEVYNVFARIKKNDKTLLPRLLQYVESNLFIDVIAKRVSKEIPKAPIFTIHDSIATTRPYVERVQKIISEELKIAIGYKPTLHLEEWNIENLDTYLQNLKGLIKKSA